VRADCVSWWTVYAWIEAHQCWERKRLGTCHCKRKRGKQTYNPCQVEADLMEDVAALAIGDNPRHYDLGEITAWVQRHVCRSYPDCNHKHCHEAGPILSFLAGQVRPSTAKTVKATA
jgi:hypothetical protein